MSWEDGVPHIEDGNVRWAAIVVHHIEFVGEFLEQSEKLREAARTEPGRRAVYQDAYEYLLGHPPTPEQWCTATFQLFDSQQDLDAYLRAYADYLLRDRAEPLLPPEFDGDEDDDEDESE